MFFAFSGTAIEFISALFGTAIEFISALFGTSIEFISPFLRDIYWVFFIVA